MFWGRDESTMAGGVQVLFVDDEPGLLETGKLFLEENGDLFVDTAESAPAALDLLAAKNYDAIVSDYRMPEMDGIEFLKSVRAANNPVPFIIFTGRSREEVAIEALNNGADFYLQKGGDPKTMYQELSHVIRKVVLMRRAQVMLAEQEERFHDLQNANDLIQSVAPDGHFLFVNKKWLDTLGYEERDLPGLKLFDIIHEECLEKCRELFQRVISGENVGIIDAVFRTRKGKRVFVEGIATCRMVDGTPQYTRGIFKDVTKRKKAETVLRESENKFATVFRNSPVALTVVSATDGTFVDVNDAFMRNTGYSRNEVIGKTSDALGLFADHNERKKMLATLREHRVIQGMEVSFRIKNGEIRACLFSSRYIRMSGKPHILSMIEDITRRKAAEAALKEREEKFRTIFDNSPYPIAINTIPDGKFIAVNAAFLQSSGYQESEILGKSPLELKILSLRDFGRLASRLLIAGRLKNIPIVLAGKEGKRVHVVFSTIPVTINNRPAIMTVTAETTSLKQAEKELLQKNEELQASEEKFRNIFEAGALGMTLALPDLRFLLVNPALMAMLGYTQEEFQQMSFYDITHPEDPAMEIERIRALEADTIPVYSTERRIVRKDGSTLWGALKVTAIRNQDGTLRHYFAQIEDITDWKKTEAAFQAMVRSMVGTTGIDSLHKITENISSWLGADCVMIGEITPEGKPVKVLSMLRDGKVIPDFSYDLSGTPCQDVATKGFCLYPDNVISHFPESRDLESLNIRGYMGTPLWNSSGQVIGILCAMFRSPVTSPPAVKEIMNIIAVKAAAEIERMGMITALRDSEERYRSFVEKFRGIAYLISPDWTPVFIHGAVREITGYSPGDFKGGHLRWDQVIHPEDMAAIQKRGNKELLEIPGHFIQSEYRIIRKDGEVRWVSDLIQNFVNMKGEILLSGILTDITERKRMEEALKEREERYRSLLEGSPDITFIIDKDDRIVYVNSSAANFLGLPAQEIIGRKRSSIFPAGIAEGQRRVIERVFLTGKRFRSTGILGEGEKLRWFDYYLVPLRDESGEVTQVFGISRDITEQKKVEEELRHANKKFSLLSSITRHDITNQLQILDGFTGLLRENISDPSLQEYLSHLEKASSQIATMVGVAKEYEMIGAHVPAWHNLRALVNAAEMGAMVGSVTIRNDIPGEIELFADPLIVKVLFNLIDNALRHGGEVTSIRFSWEAPGEDGIIVCEDDGSGVAVEEKQKIFEAGFGSNTGFGLTISREILEITGITIEETSTPGTGARFELTVPRGKHRHMPP
jgi:PAS domain S-box-containing protein